MIHQTLEQIEARLRREGGSLPPESRAELLDLLSRLRGEVGELAKTDADQARSIAGFTDLSTHEATRQTRDPRLLQTAVDGLKHSAAGFEESHPQLVHLVNSIANTLSNLGI